jgi:hypothetical protein
MTWTKKQAQQAGRLLCGRRGEGVSYRLIEHTEDSWSVLTWADDPSRLIAISDGEITIKWCDDLTVWDWSGDGADEYHFLPDADNIRSEQWAEENEAVDD